MKFNKEYLFTSRELNMMYLRPMEAKYIVIHNTANRNHASAQQEAQNQFNNNTKKGTRGVAVHFFVDEKDTYQMLPLNYHGWNASDGQGPGNKQGISIEICRSLDYATDRYAQAELRAVELVKWLMKEHKIVIGNVRRHYDFDPGKQRCPHRMFEANPRTWNEFLGLVANKPAEPTVPEKPVKPVGLYFGVGDKVKVNGVLHANSAGAGPGQTYKGTNYIQYIARNAPFPYHIRGLGWVKESAVQDGETPKLPPVQKPQEGLKYGVGATVKVDGKLYGTSAGGNPGRDYKGTNKIQYVVPGAKFPYHIMNIGWVAKGSVGDTTKKPTTKDEYIQLDKAVTQWGIYRLNTYPKAANIFAYIKPKQFGGLEYKILGKPYTNTYTISTRDYGNVNIWAGPKTAHKIVKK